MRESVRGWRADAFKRARQRAGLTQEDLAAIVGCTDTAIGSWESGSSAPQPRFALELAHALDVDLVEDLVDVDPGDATIRDLRTWAGLTQTEVRTRLGLRDLGAIERGTRPVPPERVAQLGDMYGVDEADITAAAARSREAWRRRLDARRPRGE